MYEYIKNVSYVYNEILFNLQKGSPATCEPEGHYSK